MHKAFVHIFIALSTIIFLFIIVLIIYINTNQDIISTTCDVIYCTTGLNFVSLSYTKRIQNIKYIVDTTFPSSNYICNSTIPCYYYKYNIIFNMNKFNALPSKLIMLMHISIIYIVGALLYSIIWGIGFYIEHYDNISAATETTEIDDISCATINSDIDTDIICDEAK